MLAQETSLLSDKLLGKLLEQFDKYPDPMRAEHIADLLSCDVQVIYRLINAHPDSMPHMWLGERRLIFPKAQIIPWWLGKTNMNKEVEKQWQGVVHDVTGRLRTQRV
jgi:hypothetical protein